MTHVVCGNDVFKKIVVSEPAKDGTTLTLARCRTSGGEALDKGKCRYGIFVLFGEERGYRVSEVSIFDGDAKTRKPLMLIFEIASKAVIAALNPPSPEEVEAERAEFLKTLPAITSDAPHPMSG